MLNESPRCSRPLPGADQSSADIGVEVTTHSYTQNLCTCTDTHIFHRGKRVRVFLFGNYEFQCRMYGITGAQGLMLHAYVHMWMYNAKDAGRHPCLWCTIRVDQLKQPRHARGKLPPRTLDSLQADYLQFATTGKGDIRKAKEFNNVIGPVFFNVPLSQVHTLAYTHT